MGNTVPKKPLPSEVDVGCPAFRVQCRMEHGVAKGLR